MIRSYLIFVEILLLWRETVTARMLFSEVYMFGNVCNVVLILLRGIGKNRDFALNIKDIYEERYGTICCLVQVKTLLPLSLFASQ